MENINLRAKKWGDSIAIVIPSEIVKKEGIKANDDVSVSIEKKNDLSDLFGKFPNIKGKKSAQEIKDEMREGWKDKFDRRKWK